MTATFGLTGYTAKVNFGNITGIENIENKPNAITVFPNPATDMVTIKLNNNNTVNYVVTIFTIYGQKITSVKNTNQIDISGFPVGSYFVEVQAGQDSFRKLIIKQ